MSSLTVSLVFPLPIRAGWVTLGRGKQILPTIPDGGLGKPEDGAHAIVCLASEQARWLAGQLLDVDSGSKI